jgi:hypothetical protein
MTKYEKFVKDIYPTAEILYCSPCRSGWNGIRLYRVYQSHANEVGFINEIGVGHSEQWAWYMAVKTIQKEMLRKLES